MSNTDGRTDSRPSPQQGAVPAPTTIAGAVRLSITDGRALLETGNYSFDYDTWHATDCDGECRLCAAGAVMARQFDMEGGTTSVDDFEPQWHNALTAIDSVRERRYCEAYAAMYPYSLTWKGPRRFEETVRARLGDEDNPHNRFRNNREFTAFLDHLERMTLPAIERAEAMTRRKS